MDAANLFVLLSDRVMAGPMRHQHRKLQVSERIPQESRGIIDEVELIEPQLRAPPGARDDRENEHGQNERAGDFDAVWLFDDDRHRGVEEHGGRRDDSPSEVGATKGRSP